MSGVRLGPGEGMAHPVPGATIVLKAGGDDTNGSLSMVEYVVDAGAPGPLAHAHVDREETFYVLEGHVDFTVGDEKVPGPAGSALVVPRGVLHTFLNGPGPSRLLIIHSPAGMEEYFPRLSALLASGAPDPNEVLGLMREFGMELPG